MRFLVHALTCALLVLAPPSLRALQDGGEPLLKSVRVRVTAVAGGSIFLDKGRTDHIESGDRITLHPAGSLPVEVIVRSVSRKSCRTDLPAIGAGAVEVGDTGIAFIPLERADLTEEIEANQDALAQSAADEPTHNNSTQVPEHPPWELELDDWDDTQPLLAPAFNRTPEEKPTRVRGRFYALYSAQRDREQDAEYRLGRLGTEVIIDNPFQRGGRIQLDGEVFNRKADVGNGFGDNQNTTRFRLDRASYAWGGTRTAPTRWEVGRFLQNEFPELGVLDGVEVSHRMDSGNRIGGSVGYMPELLDDFSTGQDSQVAVFYRTDSSGRDDVEFGVAYQNTWYEGRPDRNLLITNFDYLPHPDVSVYGAAWLDYYDDDNEDFKDDGLELTEARLRATWRVPPGSGGGLFASRIRYPELQREEFESTLLAQLYNNHVTRVGADGWHRFNEHYRIDGGVAGWSDQDDDGGSADARLVVSNLLYDRGEVAIGVFTMEGSFSDGSGVRVSANKTILEGTTVGLAYEYASIDQFTDNEDYDGDMSTIRASIDTGFGTTWNMSLFFEKRTGDDQDSYNLGAHVQQRF